MDILSSCQTARLHRGTTSETRSGAGGGLARAVDEGGAAALVALLDDADAVELEDDALAVRVERTERGARVTTRWSSGESATEDVSLGARPVTDVVAALHDPSRTLHVRHGRWYEGVPSHGADAVIGAISADRLGSQAFRAAHGVRYACVAGAMAGGIASTDLVVAMGRAGFLAYFGAGGLPLEAVEDGVRRIKAALGDAPAGFNLLHNPVEPAVEERTVDLFLAHGARHVDASAYMGLTPAIVRYRLHGIREEDGRVVVPNRVAAKISRPEVAEHFLKPAPAKLVEELVKAGHLTKRQAELARAVPMADDLTVEADSGGHTDRRPLPVLIPLLRRLRDRLASELGYAETPRVGAAGGIGDPFALAAALTMGAEYVMTGSVNQATREAGTSDLVKQMLCEAGFADVASGPAPDMFEIGAEVQVLSRGTMYAQRAGRLHDAYKAYARIEDIPAVERERIEKQIFQRTFDEVWADTEAYWSARDPREVARAAADPRHKMALCFRWYLGMTSRWARTGDTSRKRDFQVWCGPAMGAFNDWVRGSRLEPLAARGVVDVNLSLLRAACVAQRLNAAQAAGAPVPAAAWRVGVPAA